MGFGQEYQKKGIKDFYTSMREPYINPHADDIIKLVQKYSDPSKKYLDLAAGDGVVTKALTSQGCTYVQGLEPWIRDQYIANTGKNCFPYNFHEIARGKLTVKFDIIICSYALHLLELSFLPIFLYQLTHIAETLIILTPHKRPAIADFWNLTQEDKLNRTNLKIYNKII